MSMPIEVLVFDLGGVLVELDGPAIRPEWLPAGTSVMDLKSWLHSPWVRAFEQGQIEADEFAEALVTCLNLSISPDAWLAHFKVWPKGLYPGAKELLADCRKRFRTAILSNTNGLHWPRMMQEMGLAKWVDQPFASHLLGLAKPDPAIFQRVQEMLGVGSAAIGFFDDNADNVAAARACGWNSWQVKGIDSIIDILNSPQLSA